MIYTNFIQKNKNKEKLFKIIQKAHDSISFNSSIFLSNSVNLLARPVK